jgi:uncharacterized protein DUF3788
MTSAFFLEKSNAPTAPALAAALGSKAPLWRELTHGIGEQHAPITEQWVYSGKNLGWSLRLKQTKRAVVYLTPVAGGFRASLAMGEKAVRAAHESALPQAILRLIDEAPKYAEGRAVRLDVKHAADVKYVMELAAIKMAN